MNNDILISIRPKWVEKIIHGIKKAELRKGWFKCCEGTKFYIYCTKGSELNISIKGDEFYQANGEVIGEFICNKIYHYEAEFWNDYCYEEIRRIWVDDDGEEDFYIETTNEKDNPSDCDVCRLSCLTFDEIKEYIVEGVGKKFSMIMISDLKIYDRPKELTDFLYCCNKEQTKENCYGCKYAFADVLYRENWYCDRAVTRAPQNYCYVEVQEK